MKAAMACRWARRRFTSEFKASAVLPVLDEGKTSISEHDISGSSRTLERPLRERPRWPAARRAAALPGPTTRRASIRTSLHRAHPIGETPRSARCSSTWSLASTPAGNRFPGRTLAGSQIPTPFPVPDYDPRQTPGMHVRRLVSNMGFPYDAVTCLAQPETP